MVRITHVMSTTIDINTIKASNSLKSLDSAIRATTNAWKANEARSKSVGNSLEAAKSRYEGLGKNIESVKSKIAYLTDQQKKLDRSTQQGQEEYNKYINKLASAEKQLASMTAQQERAKRSMDYQKTGLAGLQSSYKMLNQLGQSRVERLRAEGKEYEANKTQLSTYRNSVQSLVKQQKLQADELVKISKTAGEASEAYKHQEIRLNETSTKLAKTKNAMNELSGSMKKANPTFLDRIKSKLTGVDKEAKTTHRTFKEVFAGSALGNALSNVVSSVTGKIKGAVTEGMNLNAALAKINARFKGMGMSNRYIKALDNQIGELKSKINMTGDNVANLQTKMLNWSNIGRKGAMQMTKMIAGVGDSSKLSGDKIEQMGASLMRVGSTGKVTYSALNRVTKSAPTFMAQLAKGAGMSENKLKSLLKSGKVTQTQFQKWMAAASKYSDTAFKDFGETQAGAIKYMQVRWQKLEQTMTAPLFNAKTSGLQSLKDIMSSPELQKGAEAVGNGLAKTIEYLDEHKKDIAGATSDIVHIGTELGKDMWKDFAGIVGDIGKSFGLISGNSKKSQDPLHTVKLTLDGLAKNKTAIQWISKAIIAMAAVKGIKAVTSPLRELAGMQIGKKSLIGWLAKGGLATAKGGLATAKGMLHPLKIATNAWDKLLIGLSNGKTKVGKIAGTFKSGFSKIGEAGSKSWKVISKGWSKAKDLGGRAGKGLVKGFKATGHGLSAAGKWSWNKIKTGFASAKSFGHTVGQKFVSGFRTAVSKAKSIGKGLFTQKGGAGKLNGLLQSAHSAGGFKNLTTAGKIGTVAAGAGVAVDTATSIVKAIKDKVGSRKQYEDVGTAAGKGIGGAIGLWFGGPAGAAIGAKIGGIVGKWGGDAVKSFQNGWNKKKPPKRFWSLENLGWSTHDMFKKVGNWGSKVGRNFSAGVKKSKKSISRSWNSAVKNVGKFNSSVKKNISNFGKSVAKESKKAFNAPGKYAKKGWDYAYKHSSKGTKQVMRSVSSFAKRYVKTNKEYTSATHKNFASFSKRLKANHGNLLKTLGQTAKTQLGIEKRRWSSNWKNVRSTAKGIWKGINQNAHSMYSKLNSATHGGLGKVLNGFKGFGKSLKDFWSGLFKGIKNTFDDAVKDIKGTAGNIDKFFHGKLKVGSLHLANGTDWKKLWGYPAILNDGNDSPQTGNREGLIHRDGSIEVLNGRYIKRWIFPGEGVIKASDLAAMFGRGVHLANGTFNLGKLNSIATIKDPSNLLKDLKHITKKSYELNKKKYDAAISRHEKQKQRHDKNDQDNADERKRLLKKESDAKSERSKLEKEIRASLSKGKNTKGLVKQLNALDSHIGKIKKSMAKTNPHHGQVLVDEGLLIGAKSRIGKSKWISESLFKKLINALNKKKTTTKKRTSRKSSSRRSTRSSSRTSSGRSTARVSSQHVSVRASVSGLNNVKSLARAISSVKSKSVKVSATGSSAKSISSLAKAIKNIKGGTHKVVIKTKGEKALKSLYKYTKKIKGKTHKVRVKTSGVKSLKSLQKNLTSVTKRVKTLNSTTKKTKFGKSIAKQAEEAVKSLKSKGNFTKQFASMTKKFNKDLKNMTKDSKKEFSSMWSQIEKSSKSGEGKTTHELSSFASKYKRDWKSLETGVHSTFGKFWSNMQRSAGKGVNTVISILNKAIDRIDSVISDFGGSKHAVKKSGYVHYASGTGFLGSSMRRAITKPTLAVLNDGNDSPQTGNREGIYNKQDGTLSVVNGTNVPFLLGPQHEVFNATEMRELGVTQHYAKGTGYLKKLYEEAKHNWNHPTRTGQSMFSAVSGLSGAIKDLAQGMKSKGENQGIDWWSQLWKMVEDKVNDDDLGPAQGLLKAVEKLGRGTKYSQAKRYGPDSYDCSGLVSKAMNEYYHKNWGALTVAGLWPHAHRISRSEAKPGDPIFWLPNYHVGVYAGHGMYWSAFSPDAHPQVGMHSIASSVPGVKPTFARFNGTNTNGSDSNSKDVKVKANSKLQKQIKHQVGNGFWSTIQKIADKYGETNIPGTATPEQASRIIKRAMKIAGVSGSNWLHGLETIAAHESNFRNVVNTWDSNAAAGTPSAGWFQMIEPTFKAHAKPGYGKWRNPLDQAISAIRYIISKYGGISHVPGLVSLRNGGKYQGYANGGIISTPQLAMIGEGAAPETIIPWDISKRSRAYKLMDATLAKFKTEDGQSYNYVDQERQKEEHDFMQAVLLLLRQIAAKSGVADIKLTTPQGRTLWEVIEPFSNAEQRAALIKLRRGLSGR